MVRRHKQEKWEAFLDEYRPDADADSDEMMSYAAHLILTNPHFARLYRNLRVRRARLDRRGNHEGGFHDAGWLHRAYGRKGKNRWRVK